MRPRKQEPSGSGDLFRARLDQIINLRHELVRLADEIDWAWIDDQLAELYREGGRPAVPTRFMVGLLFLKHIYGGGLRALGARPLFPVLHRRRVLPARIAA
jgi:IS5 family transposase